MRTHCPCGTELTEETLAKGNSHICKPCKATQYREYYQKKGRDNKLQYNRENSDRISAYQKGHKSKPEVRARMAEKNAETDKTEKYRIRSQCKYAVQNAKAQGILVYTECEVCGSKETLEFHHHKGYAKELWLDVQCLCRKHHIEADNELRREARNSGMSTEF